MSWLPGLRPDQWSTLAQPLLEPRVMLLRVSSIIAFSLASSLAFAQPSPTGEAPAKAAPLAPGATSVAPPTAAPPLPPPDPTVPPLPGPTAASPRSEEHTSELQSLAYLVCRLLLE